MRPDPERPADSPSDDQEPGAEVAEAERVTYVAEHPDEYPDEAADDERLRREVPPHY